MSAEIQMPRYRCHKEVWALKIKKVERSNVMGNESEGGALLRFEDPRYVPIWVEYDYVHKHSPQPGGYYVVYSDGYKSFSPADAFEGGYTLIS